ncbi:hypothetical protein BOTNAR_1128g00020 [Botryotinia narcissicola]|uniref:Uncharacterized protein n=1 Tax=Botryotinia narcissicola TaxID=278944 RepID=A0A4Z1HAY9_9HELO|nr:hypothetical protein BOTNAR_1128g00020 [Botryotinia narcissicola]
METILGIFGIVMESPETVEMGEQKGNGLVMKFRLRVLVISLADDVNYVDKVFGKLVNEARNNIIPDPYLQPKENDRCKEMLEKEML